MPAGDASAAGPRTIVNQVTTGFHGVAVTATNSDDIAGVGVTAAGGTVGVAVSGTVSVVTANTTASIGANAHINDLAGAPDSRQSVLVAAADQFHLLIVAGSLAVGSVGVGVGATVGVIDITTDASIGNGAVVKAAKDVAIVATGSEAIISVAVTLAGGAVGVAGAVGVFVMHVTTHASTGSFVTIRAGNNGLLSASDDTKFIAVTGGVAGGFVGVGVGVQVTSVTKDTQAWIGANNSVDFAATQVSALGGVSDGSIPKGTSFGQTTFHGLAVQARSSENFFGLVVAIGGGFVGIGVPVNVTLLKATTSAFISTGTSVNTVLAAGSQQSVQVAALDSFKSFTIAGGVGAGFVGIGAAIDIGIADTSTSAFIAAGSVIHAAKDVNAYALANKDVTTYAIAIGAGFVGVAGAVSVWSAGTGPTRTYDANSGDQSGAGSDNHDALTDGGAAEPTTEADNEAGGNGGGAGYGYKNILDGVSGSKYGPNGSSRLSSAKSNANSGISSKAATASGLTAAAMTGTVARGTSAAIDATVVAGGSVQVKADEFVHFFGLVVSAAGGFVGVGGAVQVATVDSNTDARIGATANINAGGQVSVYAGNTERTNTFALAFGGGVVGIGAQVTVLHSTSHQTAHIDAGATISTAGGGLGAQAWTDREVGVFAIGGGVGVVGVGLALALPITTGTTTASIGTLAGPVNGGGLTVIAHGKLHVDTKAIGVGGGVVGINAVVALAEPDLTVTASVARNTFNLTGTVDVEAFSDVTSDAFVVTVAVGAVGIGAAIVLANVHAPTNATIAPRTVIITTGDATVGVTANGHANNTIIGVSAGAAAVSVLYAKATMTGASSASIGDGSTFTAHSLTMPGVGHHSVTADVDQFGIAGVGLGGVVVYAEDSTTMDVYIGPAEGTTHSQPTPTVVTTTGAAGTQMSIDFSGPVKSKVLSLTIGLLATINGTFSTAIANQTARAYIGHQASVLGVGSVHLDNTSNITAEADGTGIGAGLGFSVGAADVTAILTPTVGAYGVGGGGSITGSDMRFTTKLNDGFAGTGTAYGHVLVGSAALLAGVAAADVLALDSPTVTTGLGAGSTATATGAVTVTVSVVIRAVADGTSIGVGLIAGGGLTLVDAIAGGCAPHQQVFGVDIPFRSGCSTAGAGNGIEARFGNLTASSSFTGTVTVDETTNAKGRAVAGALGGSLVGSAIHATTTEAVRARMGDLVASGDSNLKLHVTSDAYSEADAFAIALVGAAAIVEITATDSPYVSGYAAPFSQNGNASVITEHNYNGTTPITTNGAHAVTTTRLRSARRRGRRDERARDRRCRRRSRCRR